MRVWRWEYTESMHGILKGPIQTSEKNYTPASGFAGSSHFPVQQKLKKSPVLLICIKPPNFRCDSKAVFAKQSWNPQLFACKWLKSFISCSHKCQVYIFFFFSRWDKYIQVCRISLTSQSYIRLGKQPLVLFLALDGIFNHTPPQRSLHSFYLWFCHLKNCDQ